jgi:hypothetical protein
MPTREGELQASIHVGVLKQAGEKGRNADDGVHVARLSLLFEQAYPDIGFSP